ncbi:Symplekin [Manis pentadactyla]|nr:Symplekin [Manis pentadactyla]
MDGRTWRCPLAWPTFAFSPGRAMSPGAWPRRPSLRAHSGRPVLDLRVCEHSPPGASRRPAPGAGLAWPRAGGAGRDGWAGKVCGSRARALGGASCRGRGLSGRMRLRPRRGAGSGLGCGELRAPRSWGRAGGTDPGGGGGGPPPNAWQYLVGLLCFKPSFVSSFSSSAGKKENSLTWIAARVLLVTF